MAATALVQTRIDPVLKERAAAVLDNMGLTVSDAVRILLTRIATEGALPFPLATDPAAHVAWFRAKVQQALADPRPTVPHEDRESHFAKRLAAALRELSTATGRSFAQLALAWLRYREIPVIPIVGARRLSQFEDNLASLSLTLTPEQVGALDEASGVELGFPHDFYKREMVRTFVYGGMRDQILA